MVWFPAANAEVVNVAEPPLSEPVPMGLPPSKNVTVPVGVPGPVGRAEIVAVKVTDCPKPDGFSDEVTVVAVFALLTVWEVVPPEPLGLKFTSPL